MNAITTVENVSPATLEHVLGTGDLSKLSSAQRVEYMTRACELIGLNPLTRPFRFMNFQGQVTMYATRDCADQLRKLHKISLTIVDKTIDSEIYTVTARAKMPDGREDEDMGAVPFGKAIAGEFRANAILKCITKAKRRVTLSICGLGFLDESEVESLHGARVIDDAIEGDAVTAPAAASNQPGASTQRAEAPSGSDAPAGERPAQQVRKRTWADWLDDAEIRFAAVHSEDDLRVLLASHEVTTALQKLTNSALERLQDMIKAATERSQAHADDEAEAAVDDEMVLPE